jgi:RNA polymerase sigma-70 factor (ECF subfamily)
MISDSVILHELKANKNKGFELLFDRYYRPLVLYSDKILNDIGTSEDLVQDLFMKFWTKEFYKSVNEAAFSTYLFQAVKNASYNKLQKKDVLRDKQELDNLDIIEEEVMILNEALVKKIKQELDNLPKQTGKVFRLVFLEKLKYKEAADQLNISVNTVKTLLRNGMNHLRTVFKDRKDLYFFLLLRSYRQV